MRRNPAAPAAKAPVITRPSDGAVLELVGGMAQQGLACQAAGAAADERLWWFVDGAPVGETVGPRPVSVALEPGDHVITCAAGDGRSSSVSISVTE